MHSSVELDAHLLPIVAREWANRMAVHRKLTQKEIKGDTAFIEHSIHEVNLVLDTASSLTKIKEPHKVNMFYYLREDSQRRYDCIACITLNVPNIRAEMLDKIRRSLQRATDNGLVPLESNPAVSVTALAFELIDYCENIEIRTLINVGIGSTGTPATENMQNAHCFLTAGEAIPIIVRFDITIPIPATPKAETSTSPKTSIPPPSSSATAPSSSSSSGAVTVQLKSLSTLLPFFFFQVLIRGVSPQMLPHHNHQQTPATSPSSRRRRQQSRSGKFSSPCSRPRPSRTFGSASRSSTTTGGLTTDQPSSARSSPRSSTLSWPTATTISSRTLSSAVNC